MEITEYIAGPLAGPFLMRKWRKDDASDNVFPYYYECT